MNSNIPNEIEQATRTLQADVQITHDVTHGDENTEVAVDSGIVPSLRKRLKDIETNWAKTADPLAADLASAVQITAGYKTEAAQSAASAAAELPKVQAEGAKQLTAITAEGGVQTQRVVSEGDNQTARATAEADRSTQQAAASEQSNQNSTTKAAQADQSETNARESAEGASNSEQAVVVMQSDVIAKHDAVMQSYIPLATVLIKTQAIITEHHSFK